VKRDKKMPTSIRILIGHVELMGELFDTDCAKAIAEVLPIEVSPNVWGDEFYFRIPVSAGLDDTATRHAIDGEDLHVNSA